MLLSPQSLTLSVWSKVPVFLMRKVKPGAKCPHCVFSPLLISSVQQVSLKYCIRVLVANILVANGAKNFVCGVASFQLIKSASTLCLGTCCVVCGGLEQCVPSQVCVACFYPIISTQSYINSRLINHQHKGRIHPVLIPFDSNKFVHTSADPKCCTSVRSNGVKKVVSQFVDNVACSLTRSLLVVHA